MKIARLDPHSKDAQHLLHLSDEYFSSLYPAESNHLANAAELSHASTLFLGISVGEKIVGCGAVKVMGDDGQYGEIKRVFIQEAYRGQGLSKQLINALESWLIERAVSVIRLETGVHQPEAIGLYTQLGYTRREPYGAYSPDPVCVFMEKTLNPESPGSHAA